MLRDVIKNPVVPVEFGRNRSGMQAGESLPPFKAALAVDCGYRRDILLS